jgi:peptidoglycan/LPS O-acetylase OafA/YrhL
MISSETSSQDVISPLSPEGMGFRIRRPGLLALTGIRFFAASYVVIFHTRVAAILYEHRLVLIGNFFRNGFLAVPLFFVLSGFILAYTYEGQIRSKADRVHFWEARIARIWPTYLLSLFLSSIPGFVVPPLGAALATILMVQAWNPWNPNLAGTWNMVCWTLSVEAFFYLVFPWLQVWLERLGRSWLLRLLGAVLFLGVACNVSWHSLGSEMYPGIFRFIPFPIIHLPEFVAGVILGNLFLHSTGVQRPGRWTYVALAVTIASLMLPTGPWTSVALIGLSGLVYCLASERTLLSQILSTKLAVLGGGISYAMYLLQTPVRSWVHGVAAEYSRIPWQLVVVPIVLTCLSLVVFLYFENPARRFLRSLFGRLSVGKTA